MISPTVGRVVWVRKRVQTTQPEVALVTWVHSDICINVAGFDANGNAFQLTSLHLRQDDTEAPHSVHAEWMPYQRGKPRRPKRYRLRPAQASMTRSSRDRVCDDEARRQAQDRRPGCAGIRQAGRCRYCHRVQWQEPRRCCSRGWRDCLLRADVRRGSP